MLVPPPNDGNKLFFSCCWLLGFWPNGLLALAWLDGGGPAGVVDPKGAKDQAGLLVGVAAVPGAEDVGFWNRLELPPPKRFEVCPEPALAESVSLLGVEKPEKGADVPDC